MGGFTGDFKKSKYWTNEELKNMDTDCSVSREQ